MVYIDDDCRNGVYCWTDQERRFSELHIRSLDEDRLGDKQPKNLPNAERQIALVGVLHHCNSER